MVTTITILVAIVGLAGIAFVFYLWGVEVGIGSCDPMFASYERKVDDLESRLAETKQKAHTLLQDLPARLTKICQEEWHSIDEI